MKTAPLLPVTVAMYSNEILEMHLIFEEVLSLENFQVWNTPSKKESRLIGKACSLVVPSIFVRWLTSPGIKGISGIGVSRHVITVSIADTTVFSWERILYELSEAIQFAYPGYQIDWKHSGTYEKVKDIVLNSKVEEVQEIPVTHAEPNFAFGSFSA